MQKGGEEMATQLQLSTDLREDARIYNLADVLKIPNAHAMGLIVNLWSWVADNAPDGDITAYPKRAISEAAGWHKTRKTELFWNSVCSPKSQFVTCINDRFYIIDQMYSEESEENNSSIDSDGDITVSGAVQEPLSLPYAWAKQEYQNERKRERNRERQRRYRTKHKVDTQQSVTPALSSVTSALPSVTPALPSVISCVTSVTENNNDPCLEHNNKNTSKHKDLSKKVFCHFSDTYYDHNSEGVFVSDVLDQNINIDRDVTQSSVTRNADVTQTSVTNSTTEQLTDVKEALELSPVVALPLADETEYILTEDQLEKLKGQYPLMDIMQPLRKMHKWMLDNPTERKTRMEILPYLNQWLLTDQNNASYQKQRKNQRSATPVGQSKGNNRFNNFTSSKRDYAEIERREIEMLMSKCGEIDDESLPSASEGGI
jgi:hypothetical protein